jgi:tRNA(His) 5'-end guanylyltransferase
MLKKIIACCIQITQDDIDYLKSRADKCHCNMLDAKDKAYQCLRDMASAPDREDRVMYWKLFLRYNAEIERQGNLFNAYFDFWEANR